MSTYKVEFALPLAEYFSRCRFGPMFTGTASISAWVTNYFRFIPVWFRLVRVRKRIADASSHAALRFLTVAALLVAERFPNYADPTCSSGIVLP